MPEIREYRQQVGVSGPVDTRRASAEDFGAGIGEGVQRLGMAGVSIAETVNKVQTQKEISEAGARIAQAHAELTVEYQDQLTKGTLSVESFGEKVKEKTDKGAEGLSTSGARMYYNGATAKLNAHFLEVTARGQAQLAGAKTRANYAKSLNSSSTALLNDPSSFNTVLELQTANVTNLVAAGTLPAEKADELILETKNELAKSALAGWINLNPEEAKRQLQAGEWDEYLGTENVSGAQVKLQMSSHADQAIKAKDIEAERLKRQQEEIVKQQRVETQNKFLQLMTENKLTTKDILNSNLEAFGSGSKEQFLNMLEQNQKQGGSKIDPVLYADLFDKIHLPDGDPNKIVDENELNKYFGKGLNVDGLKFLRGEIQGKGTTAGDIESDLKRGVSDIAKGKLTKSNPLTGLRDPVGDSQYQKWLVQFQNEYQEQRKQGKTPQQLLDPNSADYLGKSISQFTRSNEQIIRDLVKSSGSPSAAGNAAPNPKSVAPRKEGESAADYLKRIGK